MNNGYLMNDVSDYQLSFDANKYARTGRKAIMIKAVEGESWTAGGVNHRARCLHAHAAGLRVVHYGFIRPGNGRSQGGALVAAAAGVWSDGDVLCADIEDQTLDESSATQVLEQWCAELGRLGHEHPIGYSGKSYLEERPKLASRGAIKGWIVADYGTLRLPTVEVKNAARPNDCFGRQFTDGENGASPHTCPGIAGPVDCTQLTQAGYEWIVEHR